MAYNDTELLAVVRSESVLWDLTLTNRTRTYELSLGSDRVYWNVLVTTWSLCRVVAPLPLRNPSAHKTEKKRDKS